MSMHYFRFDVQPVGDRYDLIIKTVQKELAGSYACQVIYADLTGYAELVAVSKSLYLLFSVISSPLTREPPQMDE